VLLVDERRLPMTLATAHYTGEVLRMYWLSQPWLVLDAVIELLQRDLTGCATTRTPWSHFDWSPWSHFVTLSGTSRQCQKRPVLNSESPRIASSLHVVRALGSALSCRS
jgi:hypothetical protein